MEARFKPVSTTVGGGFVRKRDISETTEPTAEGMFSSYLSLPGVKLNLGQRSEQVTDVLHGVWVVRTTAVDLRCQF